MTKDHYVSQVYIKHFSNRDDGHVFVYQKDANQVKGRLRSAKSICFEDQCGKEHTILRIVLLLIIS